VLVLGIETSTPQTTVALGTEQGLVASALVGPGQATHEVVVPTLERLLHWSNLGLSSVTGIAVGLGPGLFTGMRVGIATAKALSQVLAVPVVGLPSLDILAFSVQHVRRLVCATLDAKRGELFYSFYRPVPGGVTRETPFQIGSPDHLAAELEARPEDVLVVGGGALVYRRALEEAGGHVELGPAALAFPPAGSLVELAIPRFEREEYDRLYELAPLYMRKSDAEINWDRRRG
jgi:tRNA threonylcarbamoyladenosine biosynthesis protein TsaB